MSTPKSNLYDLFFDAATTQYDLPANLLRQVARFESNFDPEAISYKGAVGLMQIIPSLHPDVDPTDPYASIDYAGKLLSDLHKQFGSWDLALAAYNSGPGNVKKYGGVPPFEETQNYVKNILGSLDNVSTEEGRSAFELLLEKRRKELSITNPTPGSQLPAEIPEEGRGLISKALGFVGSGIDKIQERRQQQLESMSPEQRRTYDELQKYSKHDIGPLGWLAPGGVGFASRASRLGIIRRFSPFRRGGSKLAGAVEKMSSSRPHGVAEDVLRLEESSKVIASLETKGYNIWTKSLGGKNPSEFAKLMGEMTSAEKPIAQKGMLLSLQENLANMSRLSREAQQNLMSPAGKLRLQATFDGLPSEHLEYFNRLVETGQYQRLTRWLGVVSLAYPWARKVGRSVLERLEGGIY